MKQPAFHSNPLRAFRRGRGEFRHHPAGHPRPWVNIMSSGTYGVAVSQTGAGYSWLHHASMNRITRWNRDLIQDFAGRHIYVRDDKTGKFWSVGWQPVQARPQSYEVIHGVGCTIINSQVNDVQIQWLVFVPTTNPRGVATADQERGQDRAVVVLWTYLEWNLGESPIGTAGVPPNLHRDGDPRPRPGDAGQKRLSPLKKPGQLWNRTWDHVAWHAVNAPVRAVCGDKQAFLGNYGSLRAAALKEGRYVGPTTGKWDDGISSLCVPVTLKPGQERSVLFTVGAADSQSQAWSKPGGSWTSPRWTTPGAARRCFGTNTEAFPVKTPDRGSTC